MKNDLLFFINSSRFVAFSPAFSCATESSNRKSLLVFEILKKLNIIKTAMDIPQIGIETVPVLSTSLPKSTHKIEYDSEPMLLAKPKLTCAEALESLKLSALMRGCSAVCMAITAMKITAIKIIGRVEISRSAVSMAVASAIRIPILRDPFNPVLSARFEKKVMDKTPSIFPTAKIKPIWELVIFLDSKKAEAKL